MGPGRAAVTTLLLGVHWILNALEFFIVAWVILSWIGFFMQRSQFRWKHRRVYETINRALWKHYRTVMTAA